MNPAERPQFQLRNIVLPTFILALPILGYAGWQYQQIKQNEPVVDYIQLLTGYLKRMPPVDKLADQFVDTNGDMVADGPKNPADRIDPPELLFSAGYFEPPEKEADWQAFTAHLANVTGKKVTFVPIESTGQVHELLKAGRLHVTSFSTGAVPTAVNLDGFVPVAALAQADGSSRYHMEIIVPADSPMQTPADLKNRKVVLTVAGSHSGYKAPLLALDAEFHLRPYVDYKFIYSGSHMESIKIIAQGKPDMAAAVAADVLADAVEAKIIRADQFRSIYKSKPFPKGAWGYSCRLPEELGGRIREAFLTFSFAGTPLAEKYKGQKAVKFGPANYKDDWAYVRELDAKLLAWK